MASTIVAVYGDSANMESAIEELKRNGLPIENFRIERHAGVRQDRDDAAESVPHGNLGMMEFFTTLAEADGGGKSLIVVKAQDSRQADCATEIMSRHYPIVVEERSAS